MKKTYFYCTLIFISLLVLVSFFPLTGKDITFYLKNITSFSQIISLRNASLITSTLTILFVKYKLLKTVCTVLIIIASLITVKNIVSKNNTTIILIVTFFLLLVDKSIFSRIFISSVGFTSHFVNIFGLLLFLNLYLKNNIPKLNPLALFILGLIFSNLEPSIGFTIFILSLIYLYKREYKDEYRSSIFVIAQIIGLSYNTLRMKLTYTGFSNNLLHELVPNLCETNFIITLIFSSLVLIESLVLFDRGNHTETYLSIIGIGAYLFSSLLSTNIYLNYITYILYTISCFYILYNFSYSYTFKRKISIYYLLQLIYLFILSIFGNITESSTFIFSILQIVLIAQIYDYHLPNDFLSSIWLGALLVLLIGDIYIYKNASIKFSEMNFYLKNKLECTMDDVKIPSKYDTGYIIDTLPTSKEEIEDYIEYYHISVYDPNRTIKIEFKR